MSSCLCKQAEGSIPPLFVETVKNGTNDSIHALYVDEADHRSGATAHFHEAPLDHIGGAQLPPQMPAKAEEGQQFGQVLLELSHPGAIGSLLVVRPGAKVTVKYQTGPWRLPRAQWQPRLPQVT